VEIIILSAVFNTGLGLLRTCVQPRYSDIFISDNSEELMSNMLETHKMKRLYSLARLRRTRRT
jgi:hypothetical protein